MNNDTFSIKRLGLLFKKDFQENWKKYLMYIATAYALLTIILSMSTRPSITIEGSTFYYNKAMISPILTAFTIFGLIFASTMMTPMNDKTKRIAFLSNPSSSLEKFLYRWLIVTIGYIIIIIPTIYAADITRVLIATIRFPGIEIPLTDFSKIAGEGGPAHEFFVEPIILKVLITFYLFMQSVFILGSAFWAKNSLIKTSSVCLIVTTCYILLSKFIITLLLGKTSFLAIDNALSFMDNQQGTRSPEMFLSIFFILFTLIFWTIAYFRFKESEIINRW